MALAFQSRSSLFIYALWLLIAGAVPSTFAVALPKRDCPVILKPAEPSPYPNAISRTDPGKSVLLPDAPVKDQNKYGCCWISSVLGGWERLAKERFGREVPLSENHLILASLFYRIEEGIYFGKDIIQGGFKETADWMVTHIGLMPESATAWKMDLRDGSGKALIEELNGKIATFQNELRKLKNAGGTEEEAWALAEKTKFGLMRDLRNRVGNFPAKFEFDGEIYTPHSFAAKLSPPELRRARIAIYPTEPRLSGGASDEKRLRESESLERLFPGVTKRLPQSSNKIRTGAAAPDPRLYQLYGRSHFEGFRTSNRPLSTIRADLEAALMRGEPVLIGVQMAKDYYRKDSGIMSLAAFGATPADAALAKISGGHAVLVTGVYRDEAGKTLGYRIQNSWGSESGRDGYYLMDVDYFDTYLSNVVFTRNDG